MRDTPRGVQHPARRGAQPGDVRRRAREVITGQQIRAARELLGWTPYRLAPRAGIGHTLLRSMRRTRVAPDDHGARGSDQRSGSLFSYVDLESRVRADHPLRPIREIVNAALSALSAEFDAIYAAGVGRASIPPERLLRALLLQAFYGIRSERQLMERLEFDLLFRWFVGLGRR